MKKIYYHFLWMLDQILGSEKKRPFEQTRRRVYLDLWKNHFSGSNTQGVTEIRDAQFLTKKELNALPIDRPVVFRGLVKHAKAMQEMSAAFLNENYGDIEQPVYISKLGGSGYGGQKKLNQILKTVLNEPKSAETVCSGDLFGRYPKLLDYLERDSWMDMSFFKRKWVSPVLYFLSPQGTFTPLHSEMGRNFNIQVWGRKRWIMFTPKHGHRVNPSVDYGMYVMSREYGNEKDFLNHPLELELWDVTVEPGDVIYCPSFLWHSVEALEPSFSVSMKWNQLSTLWQHPFLSSIVLTSRKPNLIKKLFVLGDIEAYPRP
jgi:Cupin-like domain